MHEPVVPAPEFGALPPSLPLGSQVEARPGTPASATAASAASLGAKPPAPHLTLEERRARHRKAYHERRAAMTPEQLERERERTRRNALRFDRKRQQARIKEARQRLPTPPARQVTPVAERTAATHSGSHCKRGPREVDPGHTGLCREVWEWWEHQQ